jgi:hypothetical protein
MKTWPIPALICLIALPAMADGTANWQVYQQGAALELAMDQNSLWSESDGLVHFVNQERFAQRRFDPHYKVYYSIRRTTGYADCQRYQYVFVSTDLYSADNKHTWSTLYPLPRYDWKWQPVYQDSVAAAMMNLVCTNPAPAARNPNKS